MLRVPPLDRVEEPEPMRLLPPDRRPEEPVDIVEFAGPTAPQGRPEGGALLMSGEE
jgi:hypothetical protein